MTKTLLDTTKDWMEKMAEAYISHLVNISNVVEGA